MLLLQKFHGSNTGVFLLHRIIDRIVDCKRFLSMAGEETTLKICLRDYGATLRDWRARGRARVLGF